MSNSWKTPKGTALPLLNMRGNDYLQVAHRLIWFREEKPLWSIETEGLQITEAASVFKATIKDEQGRVIATAHKCEDKRGFADHTEKAETGAIGRALALVGYGTQFCLDELDEGRRIADSPITRPLGVVRPEQPELRDGHDHGGAAPYRVPFGKFQKRGLEEIALEDLRSYVVYLEKKAQTENKPLTGVVAEFIERATSHIVALETGR